jgi:hypothetical protein
MMDFFIIHDSFYMGLDVVIHSAIFENGVIHIEDNLVKL